MENLTLSSSQNSEAAKARFGRTEDPLLWIERGRLPEVARALKADSALAFDCLEHLTVMAMDDLLVATYFLRSFEHPNKQLVLRTTVASGPKAALPSVRKTWVMAGPVEEEMTERFGILFYDTDQGPGIEEGNA